MKIKEILQLKGLMLLLCCVNFAFDEFKPQKILYLAVAISLSLVIQALPHSWSRVILYCLGLGGAILMKEFAFFLPLLLIDVDSFENPSLSITLDLLTVVALCISIYPDYSFLYYNMLLLVASYFFTRVMKKQQQLKEDYSNLLDGSNTAHRNLEIEKSELLNQQAESLSLSIAHERNRIARDIHDNVGHLLSSALIQLGAIRVVNQEDKLNESLFLLNETISQGMGKVRESVHDLHKDSLNLKESLERLVADFSHCQLAFSYQMSDELPNQLKLEFVRVVQESLTNVMKHSSADLVSLKVIEQPGFYRLSIEDNGVKTEGFYPNQDGMGISSMRKRIEGLGGRLLINQVKGFEVLVIVPKKTRNLKIEGSYSFESLDNR